MRPLELILLASLAAVLIASFLPKYRKWRGRYICLATVVVILVFQVVIEKHRWQLIPASLTVVVLALLNLPSRYNKTPQAKKNRTLYLLTFVGRFTLGVIVLAGIVTSYLAGSLLPAKSLPKPLGEFAVGHRTFEWTDTERLEEYTNDPNDYRRLTVYAWYPTQKSSIKNKNPIPYMSNAKQFSLTIAKLVESSLDNNVRFPSFLLNHWALIKSNSYKGVNISSNPSSFPVIIFSHGLFSGAWQNTILMETLASHGYVVFAIEHAFWATQSNFNDSIEGLSQQVLQNYRDATKDLNSSNVETLGNTIGLDDLGNETAAAMQEYLRLTPNLTTFYETGYNLWSADQQFVMDKIEELNNSNSLFANKLDLNRIGVMGMSFGSPSTIKTCSVDKRCKAGVMLDGANYSSVNLDPITMPFLYMHSAETIISVANYKNFISYKHQAITYSLRVKNAEHFDFTDLPILAPGLSLAGQLGTIPPQKIVKLTNDYVLRFFNHHLKVDVRTSMQEIDEHTNEVNFYVVE